MIERKAQEMIDNNVYSKAFKETYIIINNLAEELYIKIPNSLIKTIKNKMDRNYEITIQDINERRNIARNKRSDGINL